MPSLFLQRLQRRCVVFNAMVWRMPIMTDFPVIIHALQWLITLPISLFCSVVRNVYNTSTPAIRFSWTLSIMTVLCECPTCSPNDKTMLSTNQHWLDLKHHTRMQRALSHHRSWQCCRMLPHVSKYSVWQRRNTLQWGSNWVSMGVDRQAWCPWG